jgi:ATP-binding cassette subfamily E protein 1
MLQSRQTKERNSMTRIAIVDGDKCKPSKCNMECKSNCPVNRQGKLCIEVSRNSKVSTISEELCLGCGICVKKCPFDAISIINLPSNLDKQTTHRYGTNSFKLHRLPIPRPGQVLGLVGTNGIGKSTAMKILAGKLRPNLGNFKTPPEWGEVIDYFRGSELQKYFGDLLEGDVKPSYKLQYVDTIPTIIKGKVSEIINRNFPDGIPEDIDNLLEISKLLDRDIEILSGGELQRLTICMTASKKTNVYMFDEPSSYLDVKQRLRAAKVIRGLLSPKNYVVVVEHDLSVLDYLSDFICVFYGVNGAYGVVTLPFSVRDGINIFLDGFVPTENLRFREESLKFNISDKSEEVDVKHHFNYQYPKMTKTFGTFKLSIESGNFTDSEIIVLLGENGTGKTTFIKMLAGIIDSDDGLKCPQLNVSYKPQKISPKFNGTVRQILHKKIPSALADSQFNSDVYKPLNLDGIIDHQVKNLSGGELQRVAIALCLGKPADIYLLDEPSAYLDSEQRVIISRIIKRFILNSKRTGFIVEHDFIMATYLADRVIVYEGNPSVDCIANKPESLVTGMNKFLEQLDITFRRDSSNFRPRINKLNSVKDSEQKKSGNFFFTE